MGLAKNEAAVYAVLMARELRTQHIGVMYYALSSAREKILAGGSRMRTMIEIGAASVWSARFVGTALAFLAVPIARGVEPPSPEVIFARHIEAIGGAEGLRQPQTVIFRGEADIIAMKVKTPIELAVRGTNQFLVRAKYHHAFFGGIRIPFVGKRSPECGFDGTNGWMVDIEKNVEPLGGIDYAFFHGLVDRFSPLYFDRRLRLARTLGVERFGKRECYRVLTVFPHGDHAFEFYDVGNGLAAGAIYPFETDDGIINVRITYSDFRRTDKSFMAPFRIDFAVGDEQYVLRFTEVQTDEPVKKFACRLKWRPPPVPLLKPTALSATEVIEKYLRALGGREAIRQHTSLRIAGVYSVPGRHGFTNTIEILTKAPNRFALSLPTPDGLHRQGFDGVNYWRATKDRIWFASGKDLEQRRSAIQFNHELHEGGEYRWIDTLGTIPVGGRDCAQLLLVRNNGEVIHEFYDLETGLLCSRQATDEGAGGVIRMRESLSDYRLFGNRLLHGCWRGDGLGHTQVVNITAAEWDNVPDSAFDLPPEVKAALERRAEQAATEVPKEH